MITTNHKAFTSSLDRTAKKFDQDVVGVVKNSAANIFQSTTENTPVSSGHLKSNWIVGLDHLSAQDPGDPPKDKMSTAEIDGKNDTQEAKLARYNSLRDIHISNSVKYAILIEHGSSKKAPQGMLGISLVKAESDLDSEFRKLKFKGER